LALRRQNEVELEATLTSDDSNFSFPILKLFGPQGSVLQFPSYPLLVGLGVHLHACRPHRNWSTNPRRSCADSTRIPYFYSKESVRLRACPSQSHVHEQSVHVLSYSVRVRTWVTPPEACSFRDLPGTLSLSQVSAPTTSLAGHGLPYSSLDNRYCLTTVNNLSAIDDCFVSFQRLIRQLSCYSPMLSLKLFEFSRKLVAAATRPLEVPYCLHNMLPPKAIWRRRRGPCAGTLKCNIPHQKGLPHAKALEDLSACHLSGSFRELPLGRTRTTRT